MRPVYQMSLAIVHDRELALVFSSEDGYASAESQMFVLPVPATTRPFDLADYVDRERFYFPAYYREEVVDVESEAQFPFIRFRVPGTDDYITFVIAPFASSRVPFSDDRSLSHLLVYVGAQ